MRQSLRVRERVAAKNGEEVGGKCGLHAAVYRMLAAMTPFVNQYLSLSLFTAYGLMKGTKLSDKHTT